MKQAKPSGASRALGFSLLETLVVVIVVAALALGGSYAYHRDHKPVAGVSRTSSHSSGTKTTSGSTTSEPAATKVSSADGKISITLPNTWEVDSQYLHGGPAVISAGTSQACLNLNDPSPCAYQVNFLPTVITDGTYGSITSGQNPASNDSWSLTVEKTSWDMAEAEAQVGGFNQNDLIAENNNSVNGYAAHFVEAYYGSPHTYQSAMAFYIIEHDGYLAVAKEQVQPVNGQSNPITIDSAYNTQFAKIAQSINFDL